MYKIANQYQLTVDELKQLNNLLSDTLNIGQKLIISKETALPSNIYIVEKGDTLYSIASAYGISVQELKELNGLTNNNLYIGQELIVPNADIALPTPPQEEINYINYKVVKGDSLWQISRKFNVTIPQIIELNNLKGETLQIGSILKIPSTAGMINTYIVKKGDTLWSIAKEKNISISELKEANNLETNLLTIGQELIIP